MRHIMNRFFAHIIISVVLVMLGYFGLDYLAQSSQAVAAWTGTERRHLLLLVAVAVAGIASLREPYDIWKGNNDFRKSCFDQASWFVGAGLSAWALYYSL